MKRTATAVLAGLAAMAGCGGDGGDSASTTTTTAPPRQAPESTVTGPEPAAEPKGTAVTVGDSEFGPMLFDSKKQAIYVFERDPKGESACYGECAEAWPPVLTKGEPRATGGVKQDLLGMVERRDGKLQVTYAGRPLYFYAHEGPGEVKCHNVNLNGGLWWVVGPDGRRRD